MFFLNRKSKCFSDTQFPFSPEKDVENVEMNFENYKNVKLSHLKFRLR